MVFVWRRPAGPTIFMPHRKRQEIMDVMFGQDGFASVSSGARYSPITMKPRFNMDEDINLSLDDPFFEY